VAVLLAVVRSEVVDPDFHNFLFHLKEILVEVQAVPVDSHRRSVATVALYRVYLNCKVSAINNLINNYLPCQVHNSVAVVKVNR
jgi:hypothetical protein